MKFSGLIRKLIPDFRGGDGDDGTGASRLRYDRIWISAVTATVIVSIIPLIILSVWNWVQYQKALRGEIITPIHNLVSNAEGSVLLFLDERKSVLKFIALDNSADAISDQERLNAAFTNLKASLGDITDLGVITSDGVQVAYVGPYYLKGVNYKNEQWFKEVSLRGEYISDVFLGFRDFPHIIIAIKRDYGNGNFLILRATVDTQKFNGLVQSVSVRPTSDTFLINQEGVIQTPTRYHGEVLQKVKFSLPPAGTQSQVDEIQDSDGQKVMIGYAQIEGTPFTFVTVKQRQELMSGLETFLGQLLAFLAVSIVIILIVILRFSTLMINNIQEADRQRTKALHEIEYSAKMVSLGRLAAGVAHEINNPLAIINEKAGMMTDILHVSHDFPGKDQFLQLADSIGYSVKRCSTITNRLLGFARHIDVQNEPIDCKALIEEVLSFIGKEAEYRSIQVDVQINQNVPTIQSDRNQLQQVFLNILNNAFAAVSDGGHIGVTIARDGPGMVSISIEDNGIGIRREDLSRIFEPFFTTKGRRGTGLGLSITYGIVKELGGEIKVTSEVNKGTAFTVTLPINRS